MPRRPRYAAPSALEALVTRFVSDVQRIIRSDAEARIAELFDQILRSQVPAPVAGKVKPAAIGQRPRLCTTASCSNPAAGPKYGWKCREHGAAYRAAKAKATPRAVAARTATPVTPPAPTISMPAQKVATVIPVGVKITKLPPGPVPRETKRTGPSMECRCPGCPTKSRGPRYDYFCADHYAAFNVNERRKFTEMWKAQRVVNR